MSEEPAGVVSRMNDESIKSNRNRLQSGPSSQETQASPKDVNVAPARQTSMILRRSKRSAMTPPGRANRIMGMPFTKATSPRAKGSLVLT